ncbi:MAG: HAD family hydrolase [Flavobacterium sp.]
MIKCVIFDMDGVVVNTEPLAHAAGTDVYKSLGITVPDDVYASFTGNSDKNIIAKLKNLYDIKLSHDELLEAFNTRYFEVFEESADLTLMPGVRQLIEELHGKGIKLILASSSTKRKIDAVFTRFGLHKYFDAIVSGEDFEESKPNPAIFVEAVRLSGFDTSECIVIEDSTNGIKAAKGAGIYCIGYVSGEGFLQDTSEADTVITDFAELDYNTIITFGIA